MILLLLSLLCQAQSPWQDYDQIVDTINTITLNTYPIAGTQVPKALNLIQTASTKYGKGLPWFISVGALIRCQYYLGFCYGYQINIGKENGVWMIAKYELFAIFLGIAEALKLEFYLAACFGNCMDDHISGWYGTIDAMNTIPIEGWANLGVFLEVGVDITDYLNGNYNSNMAGTVYIGAGLDIGAGVGVSVGAYHYKQQWKKPLEYITHKELNLLD